MICAMNKRIRLMWVIYSINYSSQSVSKLFLQIRPLCVNLECTETLPRYCSRHNCWGDACIACSDDNGHTAHEAVFLIPDLWVCLLALFHASFLLPCASLPAVCVDCQSLLCSEVLCLPVVCKQSTDELN